MCYIASGGPIMSNNPVTMSFDYYHLQLTMNIIATFGVVWALKRQTHKPQSRTYMPILENHGCYYFFLL